MFVLLVVKVSSFCHRNRVRPNSFSGYSTGSTEDIWHSTRHHHPGFTQQEVSRIWLVFPSVQRADVAVSQVCEQADPRQRPGIVGIRHPDGGGWEGDLGERIDVLQRSVRSHKASFQPACIFCRLILDFRSLIPIDDFRALHWGGDCREGHVNDQVIHPRSVTAIICSPTTLLLIRRTLVSLGFFSDIYIVPSLLPPNSA